MNVLGEPRANPSLLGHAAAEAALLEAASGGRLHHAWLLAGPEGIGKATLAYRFARRLFAGIGPDTVSLAVDPGCLVARRVAAGTQADLLSVEREWDEKRKRLKRDIAADAARAIPPFLHLTAAEGGWRVVIVDGAEDLNTHSANALLKVLEEPPPRAVLMLVCAAPGRLLPTIRSRCRRLALAPLDDATMGTLLGEALPELEPAARARLAALAEGSPGRALRLAAEEGLAVAGLVDEVLTALPSLSTGRALTIAERLGRGETTFDTFMDLLCSGIAGLVRRAARGEAIGEERRLAGLRSLDAWSSVWQALLRLRVQTRDFNLDRKQAILTSLTLLTGS